MARDRVDAVGVEQGEAEILVRPTHPWQDLAAAAQLTVEWAIRRANAADVVDRIPISESLTGMTFERTRCGFLCSST